MKTFIYIALTAIAASSCSIARNYTMEDDIYYVPGKKSLVVKEVEKITARSCLHKSLHKQAFI